MSFTGIIEFMKIQLSNQDMLRNFNNFLESVDLSNPNILEVYTHKKMIAAHPAFLVFIAAIASLDTVSHASFVNDLPPGARSLERMNVFDYVTPNKSFQSSESEPTGKFIPITKCHHNVNTFSKNCNTFSVDNYLISYFSMLPLDLFS